MALSPSDMAEAMETALRQAWPSAHGGQSLPEDGRQDRMLMFTAVARGVLRYLQENQTQLRVVQDGTGEHVGFLVS